MQMNTLKERHKVKAVTLSLFSREEVEKMSVWEIYEDQIYKENGDPVAHGINDDLMGTMDRDRLCKTCKGSQVTCPGHFAHIALARPVYHGNMIDYIRKVLRCVCFKCSHLLCDFENAKHTLAGTDIEVEQKEKAEDGMQQRKSDVERLDQKKKEFKDTQRFRNSKSLFGAVFKCASNIKRCCKCNSHNHIYKRQGLSIHYDIRDERELQNAPDGDRMQKLWPEDAYRILNQISKEHLLKMGFSKERSNPANMIIHNLAVAPPPVRPSVAMSNSRRSEDDLTVAYKQVIKQNNEIKRNLEGNQLETQTKLLRQVLQFFVATVMDNDIQGEGTQKHKSGKPIKAIRARLKGKEGRLRGNLMGKRVDFSARSVITPDPNLHLDQLGVPMQIAKNMTIPEVVTPHNKNHLKILVDRGAENWPGAKYIKRIDGRYIDLSSFPNRTDQHLEDGYIVERHLRDDDMVVFNRQPSLHKMSLMGHRIRVLEFSTFRLNLSVTSPYNADFDGDEMNMHVPQSLETKAEVKEIMHVPRQIVAPQSNKPCMGIVQDSLLGIMRMTMRQTFMDKAAVMNLLMHVKNYDLEQGLPIPAILKPKPLWTGKQIISLVIPNECNLERPKKDKETGKQSWNEKKDGTLVIQEGELLAGVLNVGSVGKSAGGLVHIIWNDLAPKACCDFLSNAQIVVNNWLVTTSFTVGVQDIVPRTSISLKVRDMIEKQKRVTRKIIALTQNGKLKQQPGKDIIASCEAAVNVILNDARNKAGRIALDDLPQDNRLLNMVSAGSKGNENNISQIMACCGQQNVEGQRIPFGFQDRSLPHFTKFDYGADSRGFVSNCYLSGLTPTELYFHAMGGREGLIDTACKTAETGYIQRRLIKALEDVMVKYDGTVRTSKEVIIQFLYGEDGLAGEHFENISIDLYGLNNENLNEKCNFVKELEQGEEKLKQKLSKSMGTERANTIANDAQLHRLFQDEVEQIKKDRDFLRDKEHKINLQFTMDNGCDLVMPVNIPRLINNIKQLNGIQTTSKSDLEPRYYFQKMKELQETLVTLPQASVNKHEPGSLIAQAHEYSLMLFKIFLRHQLCSKKIIQQHRLNQNSFDQLVRNIKEIFVSALVNPGEMVGSIGAQSMGEPATQMTLNTFHSAGISSKNVTLGVPRLKEVINVAKTIKTPSLKIFLEPEIQKDELQAKRIGDIIEYCNLSHLVSNQAIYYDPDPEHTIIKADQELIDLHNEMLDMQEEPRGEKPTAWVLRYEIDRSKAVFDDQFSFTENVGKRIAQQFTFGDEKTAEVIFSEEDMENHVIRVRLLNLADDEETSISMFLREVSNSIMNDIGLRGFPEITKVVYNNSAEDSKQHMFDKVTGEMKVDKGNWLLETDGVALSKVFSVPGVDKTKTTTNSIYEVLQVLGIEAVRNCLIRELRYILGHYGIYVNYRHFSTLCDVMTQRGILTSITRHGINRVNSGPFRKCSFEETTEILLEAAFYGEHDPLSGITENVIFGQLCPYGTGSFDLVVDKDALKFCNNDPYPDYNPDSFDFSQYVVDPINDPHGPGGFDMGGVGTPLTYYIQEDNPGIDTPQSQYPPSNIDFNSSVTPKHENKSPLPGSSHYPVHSPVYQSTPVAIAQSPSYYGGGANQAGQSVAQSTPQYQAQTSGIYEKSGHAAANYSPVGHISSNSSYSPAGQMYPNTSGQYSATTPNYTTTPTYLQYGGGTAGSQQILPNLATPGHNLLTAVAPVTNPSASPQLSSGGGNSSVPYVSSSPVGAHFAGAAGGAYAPTYNPSSPAYGTAAIMNLQGGQPQATTPAQPSGANQVTAGKQEYDPNQYDSSNSGDEDDN